MIGEISAVTNGTPAFMMPAFSPAISTSDSPRYSAWSKATLVTAVTSGCTTLVASSRPPSPTSITATSTPSRANAWHGKHCDRFKKRETELLDRIEDLLGVANDALFRERLAIDQQPLAKRAQVRTCVTCRPRAIRTKSGADHRGDGALPVRTANVKGPIGKMRVTQGRQCSGCPIEPPVDPGCERREQTSDKWIRKRNVESVRSLPAQLGQDFHPAYWWRRIFATIPLSSRRSTTRSNMPCSQRNSER